MTSSSNENATTDFSDRHIRVKSAVGEVVVRDDRADLENIEATADRMLDRAEELHEKHVDDTNPNGTYE